MTTTTPLPLVKTTAVVCDGPCRGEVTLTTDGRRGYAVAENTAAGWVEADATLTVTVDGDIDAHCGSAHVESGEACTGTARFTVAALDEAYWTTEPKAVARLLFPMDRA